MGSKNDSLGRRRFIKRATSATIATGTILGAAAGTASAASEAILSIRETNGAKVYYGIQFSSLNDNVNLQCGGSCDPGETGQRLYDGGCSGIVNGGEDRYTLNDGCIMTKFQVNASGGNPHVLIDVDNMNSASLDRYMGVNGQGDGNKEYSVTMTGGIRQTCQGENESNDDDEGAVAHGYVGSGRDEWEANGKVSYINLHPKAGRLNGELGNPGYCD